MEKNNLNNLKGCILIGGSAGSLKVILNALPEIDKTLSVPIIITLHRKESSGTSLEELMSTRTSLPIKEADDKEIIEHGIIYLAPSDYHLLIEKDASFSLDASEKINYSRPSIDATFQTAGEAFGTKLLAILLSGANTDGTEGLLSIRSHKGKIAIQDPKTALVPFMPENALEIISPDYLVKDTEIASLINNFSSQL